MADPTPADRSRLQPVPPAPVADRARSRPHLPLPLTSFVGRAREIAAVGALLRRTDVRLVTLTGPGGVGKTRLALEAAAGVAVNFPDGAVFVSLAPVQDPGLVGPTVAHSFGVRVASDRPLADQLATALGVSQLLLVLDNFEHVLEAAPLVADLLRACPGLVILATSRERLRLNGEREFPVSPLSLPEPAALGSASSLGGNAAVQLFAERAGEIEPGFTLSDENAGTVAEICRRLDGLPLAIELAAALCKVLPPPALLARLEPRLPLLIGGSRDAPTRHLTLRDTIAWSHDLLEPEERVVFRRLAVFAGGFTLEAAEAVAGERISDDPGQWCGGTSPTVVGMVSTLIDKSLIRRQGPNEVEPRFGMLETVREFAQDQLAASGEAAAVRDRHADRCVLLAEQADAAALGQARRAMFDRLRADYDNVRVALAWLLDRGDTAGLHLVSTMAMFWYIRGPIGEARDWMDRALAIAKADATPPALRARLLFVAGQAAIRQWDVARGLELLEESVALWRDVGDDLGLAEALWIQAGFMPSDDRVRISHLEFAVAQFRKVDHRYTAYVLMTLGQLFHDSGDDDRGIAFLTEALALARQHDDEWGAGACYYRLALVAWSQGDELRAVALALAALESFWAEDDHAAAVECLACLTGLAAALGQPEPAGRLLGATDRLNESLGIVADLGLRADGRPGDNPRGAGRGPGRRRVRRGQDVVGG